MSKFKPEGGPDRPTRRAGALVDGPAQTRSSLDEWVRMAAVEILIDGPLTRAELGSRLGL